MAYPMACSCRRKNHAFPLPVGGRYDLAAGFGADLAVVEVDPETLKVTILTYYSVHDAGTILHPSIAEGQVKGAALHGIGAALYEELMYDENGQFLKRGVKVCKWSCVPG